MKATANRRAFGAFSLLASLTVVASLLCWTVIDGRQRTRAIQSLQEDDVSLLLLTKEGLRVEQKPASSVWRTILEDHHDVLVHQIELGSPQRFSDENIDDVLLFKELDWLAISGSRVTDQGLKRLSALQRLGRLDIEGCDVSEQAVQDLQHALPKTRIWSDFN